MNALKMICLGLFLLVLSGIALGAETKTVSDPDGTFRMAVPADWNVQRNGQATMAATPDGRTNVVVFVGPREATTLDQWFQAMIPYLQQQCAGWRLIGQKPLTVAGRQGLLARAEGLINNLPMHADYVLVQGTKHQLMLSCNCPKSDFPANQVFFGQIIASLEMPEGGAVPAPASAPAPAPAPSPAPRVVLCLRP